MYISVTELADFHPHEACSQLQMELYDLRFNLKDPF